jgi:hypothetical protein
MVIKQMSAVISRQTIPLKAFYMYANCTFVLAVVMESSLYNPAEKEKKTPSHENSN